MQHTEHHQLPAALIKAGEGPQRQARWFLVRGLPSSLGAVGIDFRGADEFRTREAATEAQRFHGVVDDASKAAARQTMRTIGTAQSSRN